jgi:hypothetical protein
MTRFFRASGMLAAGFVLGVLAAGAGLAMAAMGKAGWNRFGPEFKQGYAAGFTDAVRVAKTADPQSYLAKQFRLPPEAKAMDWVAMVDQLYTEKENEKRPLIQIFSVAGPRLEARFGSENRASHGGFNEMKKAVGDQKERLQGPQSGAPGAAAPGAPNGAAAGAADAKAPEAAKGSAPSATPAATNAASPSSAPAANGSAPAAAPAPTPSDKPAAAK